MSISLYPALSLAAQSSERPWESERVRRFDGRTGSDSSLNNTAAAADDCGSELMILRDL